MNYVDNYLIVYCNHEIIMSNTLIGYPTENVLHLTFKMLIIQKY